MAEQHSKLLIEMSFSSRFQYLPSAVQSEFTFVLHFLCYMNNFSDDSRSIEEVSTLYSDHIEQLFLCSNYEVRKVIEFSYEMRPNSQLRND
jgi:hypothetical protein